MVHDFPGWTGELRSLQVPALLIFGDRDFSPLPDVVEMFGLLPDAQLAVLPGTTHVGVMRRPGEVLALITPFLDARDRGYFRAEHGLQSVTQRIQPKANRVTDRRLFAALIDLSSAPRQAHIAMFCASAEYHR